MPNPVLYVRYRDVLGIDESCIQFQGCPEKMTKIIRYLRDKGFQARRAEEDCIYTSAKQATIEIAFRRAQCKAIPLIDVDIPIPF